MQIDSIDDGLLARAADAIGEARQLVRAGRLLRGALADARSAAQERAFVERAMRLREPD